MVDYYALGIIVYLIAFVRHPYPIGEASFSEELKIVTTMEPDYPEDMDPTLCDIIKIVSIHRGFISFKGQSPFQVTYILLGF